MFSPSVLSTVVSKCDEVRRSNTTEVSANSVETRKVGKWGHKRYNHLRGVPFIVLAKTYYYNLARFKKPTVNRYKSQSPTKETQLSRDLDLPDRTISK
jgi:hypothetical protein